MVRKIKDRVRARFQVPVAEVAGQDTWQRVVVGFAIVGSDRAHVDGRLAEISRFITTLGEREGIAQLASDEREILSYGDEAMGQSHVEPALAEDDSWIPESWKQ